MKHIQGIPAAPGIASGPAFIFQRSHIHVERRQGEDAMVEWQRCQEAVQVAVDELAELRQQAAVKAGEVEAAIFDAHQMIARDPELEGELRAEIQAGVSAEAAVEMVFTRAAKLFEAMEDPLFRERAADFADVGRRLLCILLGVHEHSLAELRTPAIVVARDLLPSDTAQMNKALVRGFCTAAGGPLSHTAILARSLGIPAVVGAGETLMGLANGTPLILDGAAGLVIVAADDWQITRSVQKLWRSCAPRRQRKRTSQRSPAMAARWK